MKIGIIGPSKFINTEGIRFVAGVLAELDCEVFLVPDKGSSCEFFALEYLKKKKLGLNLVAPLDDNEFGYSWLNLDLGKVVNCSIWRNQPEKLNELTDVLVCLGYSAGVLAEIAYTKWFNKKPVFFVDEFISGKLPLEINLDLRYVNLNDLKSALEDYSVEIQKKSDKSYG